MRRQNGEPLGLAGLWETWTGPNGEEVDTACIVTTDANAGMAAIHDRMPVVLEPETFDAWLDCESEDTSAAVTLLRPSGEDVLELVPISTQVNKVANDNAAIQTACGPIRRGALPGPQPPVATRNQGSLQVSSQGSLQGSLFDAD